MVPGSYLWVYCMLTCQAIDISRNGDFSPPLTQTAPWGANPKESSVDHKSVAERVLQDVGGVDNIRAAAAAAPFGLLALYSCDHPQSKGSKNM